MNHDGGKESPWAEVKARREIMNVNCVKEVRQCLTGRTVSLVLDVLTQRPQIVFAYCDSNAVLDKKCTCAPSSDSLRAPWRRFGDLQDETVRLFTRIFCCAVVVANMIHWIMLINRQGKVRLSKWYESFTETERAAILRDVQSHVLTRSSKMCNVVDRNDNKLVYKRYASLYFISCIDADDNELVMMELLHLFVEVLDKYFGNVCELDLIFHFTRAYWILDEVFSAGELLECDKDAILDAVYRKDALAEPAPEFAPKTASGAVIHPASHSRHHHR